MRNAYMRQNSVRRVRTVAVLAAAMMLLSAFPAFANESDGASFDASAFEAENARPGVVMVTTAEANDTAFTSALAADTTVTQVASRAYAVKVDEGTEAQVAEQLAAQAGVASVEPSGVAQTFAVPDDEYYEQQWAHQQTNVEAGWDVTTGSDDVSIAIADTGMDSTHPDLSRISTQLKFTDGEVEDGVDGNNDRQNNGHGQHVGGIAAADSDNGTGVAGVDWEAEIVDLDVFDVEGGSATFESVAAS